MGWFNGLFIAECFQRNKLFDLKVGEFVPRNHCGKHAVWEDCQISSKSPVPRTTLVKVGLERAYKTTKVMI